MKTWQVILECMRFRPWRYFLNVIALVVIFLAFQVPGLALREFFNLLSGDAPTKIGFIGVIGVLTAAGIGKMLGHYMIVKTAVPFAFSVSALLQKNTFRQILRQPAASALPSSPGEAISRFRGDIDAIRKFPLGLSDLFGAGVSSIVAVAVMVSINPAITAVAFIPLAIVAVVVNFASHRITQYHRDRRRAAGQVTGFIGEIFGAVQSIKVADAERDVTGHFSTLNDERSRTALKSELFNQILNSVYHNAINISTGAILFMAGSAIRAGTFTVGDLVLFTYYLWFITEWTWMIGRMLARYKQTGVAKERILKLMSGADPFTLVEHGPIYEKGDLPPVVSPTRTENDRLRLFEASGLCYRYPGSNNGIEDIRLSIPAGSFTVVTGKIGSGKSTLLRVLLGLLRKDAGEIRWNDAVIEQPDVFLIPPRCAFTPQDPRLFSESLRANILLGMEDSSGDLEAAIRYAVLEEDVETLEDGLETLIGPRGVKLSGGQLQRAAAARMFAKNPEILVFDDLSSALDVETEQLLWERLFKREDTTCLVVSHRRAALQRADYTIVMKEGRIEACGDLEELLENNAEMRELWRAEGV
jgi:ATP-binding cassette subfamily B protein